MKETSKVPDGRPSDLYLVKARGWQAEILVDLRNNVVYCSPPPIVSAMGWTIAYFMAWVEDHPHWSIERIGDGTKVEKLKSR